MRPGLGWLETLVGAALKSFKSVIMVEVSSRGEHDVPGRVHLPVVAGQ